MFHAYLKLSSFNLIHWLLMVSRFFIFFNKSSPEQKDSEAITSAKGYVAPELTEPGADAIKADIYSFGVILLVLLTGQKAFDRYVFFVLTLLYQSCTLDF